MEEIVEIMERKDPEIRILAVRLPPYISIMDRRLEKIENLTIEESFVEDLRNLNVDEFSALLNSPEETIRIRPAADLRCFINLIDHLIQNTRFRKKVRLLKTNQILRECQTEIEEIYHSAKDMQMARRKAERSVRRRLERLFTDMSSDEQREINQRSTAIIDAIEEKVRTGKRETVESKQAQVESEEDELTEEEKNRGVQITRVEMRIASRTRLVPQKIMPDPDDATKFVIAVKDPNVNDLVPHLKRGKKRYVEKGRNGQWKVI